MPDPTPSKATISALKAPPTCEPLHGRQARVAATVQGHIWTGLAETVAILDRAQTLELVDQRGDVEQNLLLVNLLRIAQGAKSRREYETHRALMEEIARLRFIMELDAHEDDHWRAMADGAIETNGAQHRANGGVGVLLGQAEAVCALDGTVHPLALCSTGDEP